ncbi:MAG TPA: NDP-sugar synthase [Thermoanaerobaculia bacterium]|nr:NDP-sugar synthase [Thermoanaerobaculia bacterium]
MSRAQSRVRAVVLAAGLGVRLRPLTDFAPKPLLPVAGVPILGHTLARLAEIGCEAVAVNLHYLPEAIRGRFGERFGDLPITWSVEPEILGTLGALAPLRDFLRPAELVLLINGDSFCRWPLRRLLRRHRASGADSTLLLTRRADPARFGGGVGIDGGGRVVSLRAGGVATDPAERRFVFAGAHVFAPALVAGVEARRSDIVSDLYEPMLAAGRPIAALLTSRSWHDLGTPERYLEGVLETVRGGWPRRLLPRSWVAPEARLGARVRVRDSAVEADVQVAAGTRVERSVLLPGTRVGEGCTLCEAVVGYGAELPPGSWVERRVVTPRLAGAPPAPDGSAVGGVVYTPLS